MRLRQLPRDQLTPEQAEYYDSIAAGAFGEIGVREDGSLAGPAVLSLHCPDVGLAMKQLSHVFRGGSSLTPRTVEILTLLAAAAHREEFVWSAHSVFARRLGLTDDELEVVRRNEPLDLDDPVERTAADVGRAMIERGDLSDAEYSAATAVLTPRQIMEITVLLGFYWMRALQLRVFRIGPPADSTRAFDDQDPTAS